jgi:AcrR family transcriptional regulator
MMPVMRYPAGHKEAVRERIVTAATSALREHGPSGMSILELMKSVGLTHGGFYAHFESRDQLVAAAIEAAATPTAAHASSDAHSLEQTLRLSVTHTPRAPGEWMRLGRLGYPGLSPDAGRAAGLQKCSETHARLGRAQASPEAALARSHR